MIEFSIEASGVDSRNEMSGTNADTARFELADTDRIPVTDALLLGEKTRLALMARSRDAEGTVSKVFSGKTIDSSPLSNQHDHAFFLPEDADGDGFIDHLIVHARIGFDNQALRALTTLDSLWGQRRHTIRMRLIQLCRSEDCSARLLPGETYSCLGPGDIWVSLSPYYMTRHPKRHRSGDPKRDSNSVWIDSPEDQIRREIVRRELHDPLTVSCRPCTWVKGHPESASEYVSHRQRGPVRPQLDGLYVMIRFTSCIHGPLALGYGCHFGLGLFVRSLYEQPAS